MPASPDDKGRTGAQRDSAGAPGDDPERDLDLRLQEARLRNRPASAAEKDTAAMANDGMGIGARSGIEFLAAILVSVALGVALDRWLHTSPIALLVMMALGFGAGLLNVYRAMNGMGYGETYKTPPGAKASATKDETDET